MNLFAANNPKPSPISQYEYDEYPYETTVQATFGVNYAAVDAHENSVKGGMLTQFYKGLRHGEAFGVLLIPNPLKQVTGFVK